MSGCVRGDRGSTEPNRFGSESAELADDGPVVADADGVADVTERLLAEFDGEQHLAMISSVVLGCRRELATEAYSGMTHASE